MWRRPGSSPCLRTQSESWQSRPGRSHILLVNKAVHGDVLRLLLFPQLDKADRVGVLVILLLFTGLDKAKHGGVMVLLLARLDKVERGRDLVLLLARLEQVNHGRVQVFLRLPCLNKAVQISPWQSLGTSTPLS